MKILSFFIISIYLLGCVRESSYSNYSETGMASYYHSKFNNRKTASGDFFSQEQHTAAHKDLPFGSEVKVTNLENGKTIIVKINDRGPFIEGRIIDLSSSSFQKIGNLQDGLLNVKIELLN